MKFIISIFHCFSVPIVGAATATWRQGGSNPDNVAKSCAWQDFKTF